MPDFRTLYEQKKWNEISGMEKEALTRMSKGEATVDDVRVIQGLVAQYHTLVSSTFRSGLRALSSVAEQRVQRIVDRREEQGKTPLDEQQFNRLTELALTKTWQEQGPSIASLVQQELEKSRASQNKDFESLLDEKFSLFQPPKEPEERIKEVGEEVNKVWKAEEEPTIFSKAMDHHTEDADDNFNVPLSEKLIEEANNSAAVTEDLATQLKELTNPDDMEDREDSKIKRWWRAFKDKMPSVKGKARGVMAGLAVLLGRLLVTELMGGQLWSRIEGYFSWDNIKKMASEFSEFAWDLMNKGWKFLSDYLSLEKINKMFKEALASGLDSLGSIGSAIKSFFGFGEEEPPPPSTAVPGPGDVAQTLTPEQQAQMANVPQFDSAVPTVGPGGKVEPTVAEQRAAIAGGTPGSSMDDAPPTPNQATVPGPGKPSDTTVAPEPPKVEDNNPAQESTLVDDPLASKGAGTTAESLTKPENKEISLGDQKQNEVVDQSKAEPTTSDSQVPGGKAKGGVQSSMAGFSRGVSVDGTLTVMNFGMLTN